MCRIVPAKGRHTRERHVHLMRHRDEACVWEVGVGEGSSRAAVVERGERCEANLRSGLQCYRGYRTNHLTARHASAATHLLARVLC